MNEILSLVGFACLLSFYPAGIVKIYRTRNVEGYSIWAFFALIVGTGILSYTSWCGASYWPFVLGNLLNFVGAIWMAILIWLYRS